MLKTRAEKERASSTHRDLYRSLLKDGFLVFKLVGFKVLIDRFWYPSFMIKF